MVLGRKILKEIDMVGEKKRFSLLVVVLCAAVLVLGSFQGYQMYKTYKAPDINPVLVQQYNNLNAEFQYLDRNEKEMFNKMLTVKPDQLAPMQDEIKSIRAKKVELQNQFKKLVDEAKKASK